MHAEAPSRNFRSGNRTMKLSKTLSKMAFQKRLASKTSRVFKPTLLLLIGWLGLLHHSVTAQQPEGVIKVGIIGLDTSHSIAFTKVLNAPDAQEDVANCKVVCAYPKGSPDIESSTSRVPAYTEQMKDMGVEIVDSIDALLERCDCVLLESNDGRPHLEQYLPVLQAGKPCFIDKPLAGSLADCVKIYAMAEKAGVPVFSSSSLRFSSGVQAIRQGAAGEVIGCDAYSPCHLESTHPDLFWYGIHGVELLFTAMGSGCQSVTRHHHDGVDHVVGTWTGDRIGTFRGLRSGKSGYGGVAYGSKAIQPLGGYEGYRPLVVEIVKFFRTGKSPIDPKETLELYAFMEAAEESKRRGGESVTIQEVLTQAKAQAGLAN